MNKPQLVNFSRYQARRAPLHRVDIGLAVPSDLAFIEVERMQPLDCRYWDAARILILVY